MERRKYRRFTEEFKRQVVEEYLGGKSLSSITREFDVDKKRVRSWKDQYINYGCFPDGRGKHTGGGRPRKKDVSQMSQEEYIKYLEMENEILKRIRSLSNSQQK